MASFVLRLRAMVISLALFLLVVPAANAIDRPDGKTPETVIQSWYTLVLELVRHTATYSPPVASRAFAYLGVTAWEATASGDPRLKSLSGQLTGLSALPKREAGLAYDETIVLNAALETAVQALFSNTGPTGQRALSAVSQAAWRRCVGRQDGRRCQAKRSIWESHCRTCSAMGCQRWRG